MDLTDFAAAGPDAPLHQDARLWDQLIERADEGGVHVSAAFAARPAERFCMEVIEVDDDQVFGRVVQWPGGVGAPDRAEVLVPRSCCWDVHAADHD